MGLSNIQHRISKAGGYVWMQSEVGQGFEFYFFIHNLNYFTENGEGKNSNS